MISTSKHNNLFRFLYFFIGRSGSCLRSFETMPFMFCGSNGVCNWGARTATSYWLSSDVRQQYIGLYGLDDSREQPLTRLDDIIRQISRCSVCFACGPLVTIHSQNSSVPSCPNSKWKPLWEGYSFTMVYFLQIENVCHKLYFF